VSPVPLAVSFSASFFASGSLFDLLVGSLCGCLSGSGYSSACLSCSPFLCGCDFPTGIFGWGLFSHVIVPGICDGLGFFLALQYGRPHQLLGDSGGRIFGLWFCCNFFGFDILHLSPPVPACPALTLRPAWLSSGGTVLYFLETNFQTAPDSRNSGSDHGRHPHW
jgi:hypothetical protein